MLASPHRALLFGAFTLDLTRRVVLRGDQQLPLRRQSFDVLQYLAEHTGVLVSKDDLRLAVWPTTNVTPDSVVQCIKEIRQSLGEEARWIIRTVSGRGYVFMAEVVPLALAPPASAASPEPGSAVQAGLDTKGSAAAPEGRPHAAPSHRRQLTMVAAGMLIAVLVVGGWLVWPQARPEPPAMLTMMAVPSIAVLPFEALGSHPAEASAARALFDDVITEISQRSPHAHMISLRSSAAHRGGAVDLRALGRRLDARYLVQGSFRREGDLLHINVRLIEAETGRQLSAERFEYALEARKYAVVTIARAIGIKMMSAESRRPLPESPQAGHYVTLALAKLATPRNATPNSEALALLEKALEVDPNWVPALVRYAGTHIHRVQSGWAPQNEHAARLGKAEDAVERAMQLARRHFFTHFVRGMLLESKGDLDGAIAAMEYVLAMNPHFADAHARLGRVKTEVGLANEAAAHIEEAIRLGPTARALFSWYFWAGQAAIHVGEYAAAFQWLQKARQANPGYVQVLPWLAMAYAGLGREDEGRALIHEYLRSGPHLTISLWTAVRPLGSGVLAEQRSRIVAMLKQLGVPEEGRAQTGAAQ